MPSTIDVEIIGDGVGSKGETACQLLTEVMCRRIVEDVTSASLSFFGKGNTDQTIGLFKTLWLENLSNMGSLASSSTAICCTQKDCKPTTKISIEELRAGALSEDVPLVRQVPNSGIPWALRPAPVLVRPHLPNSELPRVVVSSKNKIGHKFDGIEECYILQPAVSTCSDNTPISANHSHQR
jgi:hypothetical protein